MTFSVDTCSCICIVIQITIFSIYETQSNAPNTETYYYQPNQTHTYSTRVHYIYIFQMSKWRHHYQEKCNFVHIATSSFLVEQFCDTGSCMANQKDGDGDLHYMCHLLVHVSQYVFKTSGYLDFYQFT